MKNLFWLVLVMSLAATSCQALSRRDPLLTLEAESISYAAEATNIRQTAEFERTSISVTAQAAETQIALVNGVNQQLRSTLSIQVTPTISVVAEALPETQNTDGRRWFTRTGMSTQINSADGCVVNPGEIFSTNDQRIYATAHVVNLNEGALLRSDWLFEGTSRYDFEWVVDQNYDELCIWFYIDPTITEFTPGAWQVQLYADGFPLEGPMTFMIEEPMQ